MEETNLMNLPALEVSAALRSKTDIELIELLNSKYAMVGDTAVDVLCARNSGIDLVINGILSNKFTRRNGKMRALSVLLRFGLTVPEAINAYLYALNDRNKDVCGTALFGIVFFQDKEHIGRIIEYRSKFKSEDREYERASKAIEALGKGDPSIFSPYFRDGKGVWKKQ